MATTVQGTQKKNSLIYGHANSKPVHGKRFTNNFIRIIDRKLKIANSIWLGNEINGEPAAFKDNFIDNAAKNFYASSYNVNLDIETGSYGKWISENTNGTYK